ncbi:MAG: glycosyltransferase family 39 protein [Cytophagales bacterium]|nr:glycosyltransferase family 39 protein [Cytophagales bacterium]
MPEKKVNTTLLLLVILAVGTALRLFRLSYQSLWYDELHSMIPTNPANTLAALIEYCKTDQPPAYFIMLHYWFKLVGYNEFYGRLFSALIGVLGLVAMYLLGREAGGRKAGLLACFFTAINWFHILYSQEVRFYGLLFLFTTLSYLFFIRAYRRERAVDFIGYTLISIGIIYTHYYGMVVLLTQLITFAWMIYSGKRSGRFIGMALASGIAVVCAFIPWMPTVLQDNDIPSFWIQRPNPFFWGLYFYVYLGKDPVLGILYVALGILYLQHMIGHFRREGATNVSFPVAFFIIVTLWIGLTYLIPYLQSILSVPVLHERYTIITLPALFLVFALGLLRVKSPRTQQIILGVAVLSTTLNFLFFNQYYTKLFKNQFREAALTVMQHNRNGTKVYSDQDWFYNFYFENYGSPIRVTSSYGVDFSQALAGDEQVWVLKGMQLPGVDSVQQQYLNAHFPVKKAFQFLETRATLYQKANRPPGLPANSPPAGSK